MNNKDKNSKENRVLASTVRLFNQYGIMVPVSKISQDAGVATGTPFAYFDTKEELLKEAYTYARMTARPYMELPENMVDNPEQAIKNIVINIIRWAMAFPEEYRYVSQYEDVCHYDYYSDEFKMLFSGIVDALDIWDLLSPAVRSDLPKEVISRMISVQCEVFCRYIAHCQMEEGAAETERFLETSADSIWNSIKAK